ncbi:RNA polymerase sigma factor [Candidatus Uhrbacteria bacterium]|jgi:RNA polymerase sigma-70 factor, ECF subfamily|nr:RNA polymerase sigma factor [Candidatus Uhrbacteria bacterium]
MKRGSFEQFYKENIGRIHRYVFFRVGQNRDVCEDLVSEIFMKALKNFEKFDPKISKSAWIYRIAHNHLSNHYRDTKTNADIEDVKFSLVGERGEETALDVEEQGQLIEALDELPPEDRRIVTMKYIEGYSYKEIGEILGRTSDALKVASYRAVKKLRKIMKPKQDVVSPQATIEETQD